MAHRLRLLRWLYIGRLTLAGGIFTGALGAWTRATAGTTLVATLGLITGMGVTLFSLWWTEGQGRPPGRIFLYAQLLYDTLLVTAVVHITTVGNVPSDFSALYVLVIAAGALLLPLPGGMVIGALASCLYLADMLWLLPDVTMSAAALPQIVLFVLLALVTAGLGDRLRRTGTALGEMESQLRQLRTDTNEIMEMMDTGMLTVDSTGRLVHSNRAAQALLAMDDPSWRGRGVLEELDRRAPGLGSVIARTIQTQVPVRRHELRLASTDGDRYLGLRTTVMSRRDGPWVTAVLQDVTEFKQVEDLVRRAERLQAVAELGASLAHEIKNPLASIRSSVEQLTGDRLTAEDRMVLKRLVLGESDRLSRLLSDFMEFSRLELRRWRIVDLRDVVNQAMTLVTQHPDADGGPHIEFDVPSEPILVDGDEDLLHRAVFNLLLNAVQHSGVGGRVHIALGRAAELDLPASVRLDGPARITVQDSGPGIKKEDVPHLFDPFFTTRMNGNGLGLAMVHRAVEAHGGAILVDGNPGTGAKFTVYLPSQTGRRR
jgi:two-component system sensor histidine kinase PilS (NtrC family)